MALRNAAVNELVWLKPTVMPISVTDKAGLASKVFCGILVHVREPAGTRVEGASVLSF